MKTQSNYLGKSEWQRYVVVFLFISAAFVIVYSPYLLHGWILSSEYANAKMWGEWVNDFHYLKVLKTIPEWKKDMAFGVNGLGRDPFFSSLSLGNIFMFVSNDPKTGWIAGIYFHFLLMGFGAYLFYRSYDISHIISTFGAMLTLLYPGFPSFFDHGPGRVITGISLIPWFMFVVHRAFSGVPRLLHFIWIGVIGAAIFLGSGAWVSQIITYLIVPYLLYSMITYALKSNNKLKTFFTAFGGAVFSLLIALGLAAYLLLPLIDNLHWSQRSLYGMPAGNGIGDLIALFFPWQGRIYTLGYYDTPIVIPGVGIISNYYKYFGILAVPLLIYLFYTSDLRRRYVFFCAWFLTAAFLFSKIANKVFPLMSYFEKIMNTNSNENWIIIDVIICFNMIVVVTLDDIVKKRRSNAIDAVNNYKIMNKLLTALMVIYTFIVLAWVTAKVVLMYAGSIINKLFTISPFSSLIMNDNYFIGLQLVLYSYFYDHFFYLLLISFLVRLITLWLFKKRLLLQKMPYDIVLIVILIAIDLTLFNYYVYPFTSSNDISYSPEIKQNAFIEKVVKPDERVGAFPIELKIPYKLQNILKSMKEKHGGTIPWDPIRIHNDYSAFNVDKGYFEPLFDPGSTFYPVTVGKQIYNNHQSLLPLYFWEYDKAMNKDSGIYNRQSWVSIQNPHSRLLDAAGIKYIFWYQPIEDSRLELVERYPIGDGYIYLNKRAVPKAYIVSNIEYYPTNDKVLERIADETFDPHTAIATDDSELAGKLLPDNSTPGGSADIEEYSADKIQVTTKTQQKSMLVIPDLYFPYWTAKINGTESKIYKVNGVFRGIIVDKGENRIVLEFYNKYYHMGLKISLFTLILTLSLLAVSGLCRSTS